MSSPTLTRVPPPCPIGITVWNTFHDITGLQTVLLGCTSFKVVDPVIWD